jgi:hypothetical protein
MNRKSAAPVPPVSIWLELAVLALSTASGFAQNQTERLQFDAASVRVNESAGRPSTRYDPVRVDLRKASIKHLVRRAWPLPDYQIVWPAWVDGQRFARGYDVSVTFPRDTSPEQLNLMFQDLLATRFGLVTHWETRELKAFEVRVSGQGSRLQEAQNPAPLTDFPKYTTRTVTDLWHFSSQLGGAPSHFSLAPPTMRRGHARPPLRKLARAPWLPASAVSAPEQSSCAVRQRTAQVAQARRSDRLLEPRSSRRVSNRSGRPIPSAV